MPTIDAELAVALALSATAMAVIVFVLTVIAMLVVIHRNPAGSYLDEFVDD